MYTHYFDTYKHNINFGFCHASVNLDNVDLLYLEDLNVHKPVLENKTATVFFLKKPFLVWSSKYKFRPKCEEHVK